MSHLLRLFPPRGITIDRAEGTRVWDTDGREYLDVGGANHGVALLGHRHPGVIAAIEDQLGRAMHVTMGMDSPVRSAFLDALHERLPAPFTHTFLANSGTEAWECALKLAAAHTGCSRFIAAHGAFHGRTLGSLSTTHKPAYREPFTGTYVEQSFVPYNDVEALKEAVGSDVAAVCLEPIQGEAGVVPATQEYLRAARDLATDHGALLLIDEIQTGFGRTGPFLAADRAAVTADITTLAKGVAGGLPIGTCSVTEEVAEGITPGSHGTTYGGNPLVCAAGHASLQALDRLHQRAPGIERMMRRDLGPDAAPIVREVRGHGAMLAVDLKVRAAPVLKALQDQGVLALAAGTRGIRLLPPLTWTEEDQDRLHTAFTAAVEVLA